MRNEQKRATPPPVESPTPHITEIHPDGPLLNTPASEDTYDDPGDIIPLFPVDEEFLNRISEASRRHPSSGFNDTTSRES